MAILLAAVALGLLLVRAFYPREEKSVAYKMVTGSRLRISGVNFSSSERTVLLALSKTCHYCRESSPFYKRLDAALKNSGIRTIALFPENESEVQSYLSDLGITVNETHNVSLPSVGVTSIPMLVITDSAGSVLEFWKGKLPPRVQTVVFERLNLPETLSKSEWLVEENELPELLRKENGAIVLDVRDRESFSSKHLAKAVNIPLDELQVRAGNELSPDKLVVITAGSDFDSDLAYTLLDQQGFSRILTLPARP